MEGPCIASTDFLWRNPTFQCMRFTWFAVTGRTGERERETNHIMNGSAYGHRQLDRYRHGHQLDMERTLTVTIITV